MKRPIMNRNIASGWLVIVFAATFVVSMAAPAQAAGSACSLARAAGTYAFSTSGTVVGVGPKVSAGILTLDAAGNLTNGKATSSFNGAIAGETFSGTYVKQFRGFFTSATLPDGTSLLSVISADGSKMVPWHNAAFRCGKTVGHRDALSYSEKTNKQPPFMGTHSSFPNHL